LQAEAAGKGQQTVAEVFGDRAERMWDTQKAEKENLGQNVEWVRPRLAGGQTRILSTQQDEQMNALKQIEPVLQSYREMIQYAYGPGGPLEHFQRRPDQTLMAAFDQAVQADPKLDAMRRNIESQMTNVARALESPSGRVSGPMLEQTRQLLASVNAGVSFGRLGGGVLSLLPVVQVPDRPDVARNLANQLFTQVNKQIGGLMGNPNYEGTRPIEMTGPPQSNEAWRIGSRVPGPPAAGSPAGGPSLPQQIGRAWSQAGSAVGRLWRSGNPAGVVTMVP